MNTEKISAEYILNSLPSSYYVINLISKKIIETNDPEIKIGESVCYKQLFNKSIPCENRDKDCICQQLIKKGKKPEFLIEKGEPGNKKIFKANASLLDKEHILVNYIDISEQFKFKKELKINIKRLERAEKLADFGYWEFNLNDQIMLSSEGARIIYGVSGNEMHLTEVQKIPLQEYRLQLDQELKDLIKGTKPYNIKFRIKRPLDGEIRCVHSVAEFSQNKNMVFGVIHDITETSATQAALKESENNLNLLFENMNSAFAFHKIVKDKNDTPVDYIFLQINSKFEELVGKTRDEILNKSVLTIFPETEKYWIERYGKVAITGESITFSDYSAVLNRHFDVSAYSPKMDHFAVTFNDITHSKTIEDELNKSNQLLRTVIDNIPDAIYMKDVNFRKLLANKGDAVNCGVKNISEIIGKTDYDIYPKEVADKYTEDDREVIENGKTIINREEFLPSTDKERWVLTSKFPLKNDDNEIVGLVGIGRDITEMKSQQSQLGLLHQTIEQSPLAIVITNPEGIIEYVNPGFSASSGFSYEEAMGKNPSVLKSGLQSTEYYKELWETIIAGKSWSGELHNKRKDGTLYWESTVITPILNSSNEIEHFVAIKEDITEKKQMIRDLQIAKEKAEESDRLKTMFLANMSHEIRTPLNGILGFSSLICTGINDEKKLQDFGKIIENSGQRLISVIDDIIDISMIQSNQLKLNYETFDINDLLEEMYVLYQTQKTEKLEKVKFHLKYCEMAQHQVIYSDKNRVYQVVKNLLDNAFKFTETGYIEFGCYASTDNELILFVKDTGLGIEESKTKIIFESFRQADEGNSRKFDGSGLGLAIISGILNKMEGQICVESQLNNGSVFYVNLPRNEAKTFIEQAPVKDILGETARINNFKRIVSFEDDLASIEYLKIVVDLLGFHLVNFTNAKEGIEYLRSNSADLVLMDVQLPEMNGYEATKILKAEYPDLPVVIQTAYAMKGDREIALQSGCDDYLSKPISLNELKEKVNKLVVRSRN